MHQQSTSDLNKFSFQFQFYFCFYFSFFFAVYPLKHPLVYPDFSDPIRSDLRDFPIAKMPNGLIINFLINVHRTHCEASFISNLNESSGNWLLVRHGAGWVVWWLYKSPISLHTYIKYM